MNEPSTQHADRGQSWLLVGVAAVLAIAGVWAFWPTLLALVEAWQREPDYSHGFLVGPIAIYLVFARRATCPADRTPAPVIGMLLIGFSLLLRFVSAAWFIAACDGWAIVPWIAGIICVVYGWRVMLWAAPAFVFLLFMVPLPFRAEYLLSQPLQRIATVGSVWLLQTFGETAFAEGNVILLKDRMLEVERACAGLRIFVSVVALAYAGAVLSRRPWPQKALLLASALPVAVFANVLRIVATAYAYRYGSTEFARALAHDMAGLVMIPLALLMVGAVHWYLSRLFVEIAPMSLADVVGAGRGASSRAARAR